MTVTPWASSISILASKFLRKSASDILVYTSNNTVRDAIIGYRSDGRASSVRSAIFNCLPDAHLGMLRTDSPYTAAGAIWRVGRSGSQ